MSFIPASKFAKFSKTLCALGLAFGFMTSASAATIGTGSGGVIPDSTSVSPSTTGAGLFTSQIMVSNTSTIAIFNSVTLTRLSHTWSGDLGITLSHGGVTVDLVDRLGANTSTAAGSLKNFNGTYTFMIDAALFDLTGSGDLLAGTYAPVPNAAGGLSPATATLSDFNGQNVSGTWTLAIRDFAKDDKGSLESWSIDATLRQADVPLPGSAMLLGLGLFGLIVRRRI